MAFQNMNTSENTIKYLIVNIKFSSSIAWLTKFHYLFDSLKKKTHPRVELEKY